MITLLVAFVVALSVVIIYLTWEMQRMMWRLNYCRTMIEGLRVATEQATGKQITLVIRSHDRVDGSTHG